MSVKMIALKQKTSPEKHWWRSWGIKGHYIYCRKCNRIYLKNESLPIDSCRNSILY